MSQERRDTRTEDPLHFAEPLLEAEDGADRVEGRGRKIQSLTVHHPGLDPGEPAHRDLRGGPLDHEWREIGGEDFGTCARRKERERSGPCCHVEDAFAARMPATCKASSAYQVVLGAITRCTDLRTRPNLPEHGQE